MQNKETQKNKSRIAVLVVTILVANFIFFHAPKKAEAYLNWDIPNDILQIMQTITSYVNEAANVLTTAYEKYEEYMQKYEAKMLPYLKKLSIEYVNDSVLEIVTEGNNGKPYIITDWKSYLYKDPENKALVTANSLIEQTLGGRSSSSGYSNSETYAYFEKQMKDALIPKEITPNLTTYTPNPTKNLFESNNMMAFNAILKAENNVFSLVNSSMQAYQKELAQEKEVALNLQKNGYLPKMDSAGNIMTPAANLEDSVLTASKMGTNLVTDATQSSELASSILNVVMSYFTGALKEGLVKVTNSETVQKVTTGMDYVNRGINTANNINQYLQQQDTSTQPDTGT